MIMRYLTISLFLLNLIFSVNASSNDYMSVELEKAIDIECKKSVKNNLFNSKEECRTSLLESLYKVGIVSVTRVNDVEQQGIIEKICVFAKKRGALEYNKCIHKQVYKYLGIEFVEMPLVVNEPIEESELEIIVENINQNKNNENNSDEQVEQLVVINEEDIFEKDTDKIVTEINPDVPITEPKVIEMPENLLRMISQKAVPSTYYVLAWNELDDQSNKIKYWPEGMGSAVAIAPNLLATACHVVTKRIYNEKEKKIEYKYLITNVIHVNDNVSDQSKWYRRLELFAEDFNSDRCILKHDDLNAIPASTRDYEDLKEFEKIYAVGNPRGYLGKTAEGIITRLYDYVPPIDSLMDDFKTKEIQLIETNAPVDKGNSGGGLFDTMGNLIGIAAQCEIVGGPEVCYDEYGHITLEPENRNEQCTLYCNKTQPQNWFIPISRYPELTNEKIF